MAEHPFRAGDGPRGDQLGTDAGKQEAGELHADEEAAEERGPANPATAQGSARALDGRKSRRLIAKTDTKARLVAVSNRSFLHPVPGDKAIGETDGNKRCQELKVVPVEKIAVDEPGEHPPRP